MRSIICVAITFVVIAFASETLRAEIVANYDPATGNVTFEGLANIGGIRLVGPGVPANPPADLGGFADSSIANEVSWLWFSPRAGTLDLGNMFPTGLWVHDIAADYQAFVQTTGTGLPPDQVQISGGIIPEPSTMLMAGMGLVGLAFRRRRNG